MSEHQTVAASSEIRSHWTIVLGAFLGVTFGIASLFGYTVGIFMKPLQAEFGWTRSEISLGLLLSTLTIAASAPMIGYVADRVNLRKLVLCSCFGVIVSFVALANLWPALWLFMLLMALMSFLSSGTSPVVYTRLINQWFDRSRGLALGLVLAGNGVAAALFPRILAPYVAEHGWRAGYLTLAAAVAIVTPLVFVLIRDRRSVEGAFTARVPVADSGVLTRDALRSRQFWVLAATLFFPAVGLGGIAVHIIPMLSDAGVGPGRAGAIAGILGISVIIGRIVTGFLIDRFFAPRVAATIFAITACGCFGFSVFGIEFAPFALFLVGLATGAEVDIIGYLIARYFGLRAYGVLYGLMYAAFMLGTSLSQMLASVVFDTTGSYRWFLMIAAASLALGSIMALLLPQFETRPQTYAVGRADLTGAKA